MINIKRFILFSFLTVLVFLSACSASTEELASEVQASMEAEFAGEGIEIQSFDLTHRGGNEYRGILKTREPHGEFTYTVEVIYDGRTFSWEVRQ